MSSNVRRPRWIFIMVEVVKKLWGCIIRKRNRLIIKIIIKMENEKKENSEETIDVEVQCMAKGELIDSITASVKLKNFKAMEPEP